MSAVFDPSSIGLPPELQAELQALQRRQQMVQLMTQQAQQPLETPQPKGRLEAKTSPISVLAKVAQAYMAKQMQDEGDKSRADFTGKYDAARNKAMGDYQATRDGAPAQQIPYGAGMTNDDEGNPLSPVMKDAVAANPRQAIVNAMTNPLIAKSPVIAADMKKMEPNWAVHKSYDDKGNEVQKLVNLNDPTQTMAFGGTKAPKMEAVTTTDSTGRPVTSFVNPNTQTAPLPQPVKMEMKDTGKVIVPVDPYAPVPLGKTTTPDSDQSAATAKRGQDISRSTSLQVHGLGPDGLPTGDIKDVAKGIAEGRLPPLTSMALGTPRGQMIMSEVVKVNPEYDVKEFHAADKAVKDFATGKQGNTVRSLSVLQEHGGTLRDAVSALQNGDNQLFNKASNYIAEKTGATVPSNFDAVKNIYKDELVKAILGSGGALGDRTAAEQTLSRASSPQQLLGVMDQYDKLMAGQLHGLRRQYEQSTNRKDFDRFLSERAREVGNGSTSANSDLFQQADAILGGK